MNKDNTKNKVKFNLYDDSSIEAVETDRRMHAGVPMKVLRNKYAKKFRKMDVALVNSQAVIKDMVCEIEPDGTPALDLRIVATMENGGVYKKVGFGVENGQFTLVIGKNKFKGYSDIVEVLDDVVMCVRETGNCFEKDFFRIDNFKMDANGNVLVRVFWRDELINKITELIPTICQRGDYGVRYVYGAFEAVVHKVKKMNNIVRVKVSISDECPYKSYCDTGFIGLFDTSTNIWLLRPEYSKITVDTKTGLIEATHQEHFSSGMFVGTGQALYYTEVKVNGTIERMSNILVDKDVYGIVNMTKNQAVVHTMDVKRKQKYIHISKENTKVNGDTEFETWTKNNEYVGMYAEENGTYRLVDERGNETLVTKNGKLKTDGHKQAESAMMNTRIMVGTA